MKSNTNTKGTVIIGGTRSDAHVVSIYIATMMLEESGYDVVNLSCQNETPSFFSPDLMARDLIACIICNQNGHAIDDLRDLPHYKPEGVPVALAGHYTLGAQDHDEQKHVLKKLGVDCFLDTLDQLLPMLEFYSSEYAQASSNAV